MPSVKLYHRQTHTVPIPMDFFTKPLQSHIYAVVRPMAISQKYRSSACAYPFPVEAWREWSSRLPGGDIPLKMKRRSTYEGLQGDLVPTEVTNTKEQWSYVIPASRTEVVNNICDLQTSNSRRAVGAAKLNLPSKAAIRSKQATAQSMSQACGPIELRMTSPKDRRDGKIGKLRCKLWCGQLMFDKDLTFKFPEQARCHAIL
jgi:hypothetical protein